MAIEQLLAKGVNSSDHQGGYSTNKLCSYHVPKHIQEHLDYITPGIKLVAPNKRNERPRSLVTTSKAGFNSSNSIMVSNFKQEDINDLSVCNSSVTPACIRALYQFPELPEYPWGQPRPDNSLGIFEEGDFYVQTDLDLFFGNLTSNVPVGTSPVPAFIDGAYAPLSGFGDYPGESDLDFELAIPIIYPQNVT
jgi:tripeptidyl-peptidase-1